MIKAWSAIAQVGGAPASPEHGPLGHVFADGVSAVSELCEVQNSLVSWIRLEADHGNASRRGSRIKLDGDRLEVMRGDFS